MPLGFFNGYIYYDNTRTPGRMWRLDPDPRRSLNGLASEVQVMSALPQLHMPRIDIWLSTTAPSQHPPRPQRAPHAPSCAHRKPNNGRLYYRDVGK